MMWNQDWLLDLSPGEVTIGLDKSHFRGRKEKNQTREGSSKDEKRKVTASVDMKGTGEMEKYL